MYICINITVFIFKSVLFLLSLLTVNYPALLKWLTVVTSDDVNKL